MSNANGATPLQIVEALYEGFRRRDFPAIFGLLSPDVEIVQSDKLPWGGCYRGHEGARQFFGQLASRINSTLTIERLIDSADYVARGQFFIDHPKMLEALEPSGIMPSK
jgi:ketosteroid isomerase-like protein